MAPIASISGPIAGRINTAIVKYLSAFTFSWLLIFSSIAQKNPSSNSGKSDDALNRQFWTAMRESRFEDAMELGEKYYYTAFLEKNTGKIFESLSNMFTLYQQMGNYEKSFEYAGQLYDIAIKSNNKPWIQTALWSLAQVYSGIEDYPGSLNYFRRAQDLINPVTGGISLSPEMRTRFGMQFASVFSRSGLFDSAHSYLWKYKPIQPFLNRFFLAALGEYYFLKGDYPASLQKFRAALVENISNGDLNETMRILDDMAQAYLALGHGTEALKYGREFLDISLKVRSIQFMRDGYKSVSDAFDRLGQTDSSNYYFRKYTVLKDAILDDQSRGRMASFYFKERIAGMNRDKEIQAIQLQKQTLIKNFLIGGMITLVLLAVSFSRIINLKRKWEARRRELAENELHIEKLESEKAKALLLQQKADLEMKALRAQMNPHFIFNCLNSINLFIIQNDGEKAASYLTKFAKLIRMVLEKSGQDFIPLGEELDCLALYMDLESLRFNKPFLYQINIDGIDKSSLLVPTMMIQPFIENAIWHGLHQGNSETATINLNLKLENEFLNCEIIDNGIGLEASAAVKSHSGPDKKSLGIEITKNRLKLADPSKQPGLEISILDLRDPSGLHQGTSVSIRIPVKKL